MKIVFTGGGTMGSVIPLLAVADSLKEKNLNIDYLWIGTKKGPEKEVVQNYNIEFKSISSGKLRRYFSLHNFLDIFRIKAGFFQSLIILKKFKPHKIVSAGGFVAVPVVWAGWLLGIPIIIHQQDVRPGLANKLCAWCAEKITVCFPETAKHFKKKKIVVVGNPVREALKRLSASSLKYEKHDLLGKYNLKHNLPTVLITAGGRGSLVINNIVLDSLKELTKICQVVHITGRNCSTNFIKSEKACDNYHRYEFMIDNTEILKLADLAVSRAGMSILTELSYLSKPSIIIPLPGSHQEDNAEYFAKKDAVEILTQKELNEELLVNSIREILKDKKRQEKLSQNIHGVIKWGAEKAISDLILE
ncbi:MAG: undecaprenyldiphospho-muramoylpentapeptide beta-N-acetylglucosaminyltransferase [Candidatus Kuenenbacteria bacterium]